MSTVSGQISGKGKSGKKTTLKFSNINKKLPAAQAAKFMKEFRGLLKKYKIPRA